MTMQDELRVPTDGVVVGHHKDVEIRLLSDLTFSAVFEAADGSLRIHHKSYTEVVSAIDEIKNREVKFKRIAAFYIDPFHYGGIPHNATITSVSGFGLVRVSFKVDGKGKWADVKQTTLYKFTAQNHAIITEMIRLHEERQKLHDVIESKNKTLREMQQNLEGVDDKYIFGDDTA